MSDPSSIMEMSESESEGPWESCPSDTEGSDAFGNRSRHFSDHAHLRVPIALGIYSIHNVSYILLWC